MTVKELIMELLECDMDSEVSIALETDKSNLYTRAERFKVFDCIGGVIIEGTE